RSPCRLSGYPNLPPRGVIAHELLGVDHRRRPEFFGEANLVLLAQLLIAQQNHEILVPGVLDLREGVVGDVPAQVDADDLGAQRRRQRPYGEPRRTKLRVDASTFHATAQSLSCCPPVAVALGTIMGRDAGVAQGSFASMRMKAMRQGSVPRLTQAGLGPCCSNTSPAVR